MDSYEAYEEFNKMSDDIMKKEARRKKIKKIATGSAIVLGALATGYFVGKLKGINWEVCCINENIAKAVEKGYVKVIDATGHPLGIDELFMLLLGIEM